MSQPEFDVGVAQGVRSLTHPGLVRLILALRDQGRTRTQLRRVVRYPNREIADLIKIAKANGYVGGGQRRCEKLWLTDGGKQVAEWYVYGVALAESILRDLATVQGVR